MVMLAIYNKFAINKEFARLELIFLPSAHEVNALLCVKVHFTVVLYELTVSK
jgi:hypothetical protein